MEDIQNVNIMIVDDTSKNIQVLGSLLAKEGFNIYVAQSGYQALESLKNTIPDLILLDA